MNKGVCKGPQWNVYNEIKKYWKNCNLNSFLEIAKAIPTNSFARAQNFIKKIIITINNNSLFVYVLSHIHNHSGN